MLCLYAWHLSQRYTSDYFLSQLAKKANLTFHHNIDTLNGLFITLWSSADDLLRKIKLLCVFDYLAKKIRFLPV